MGLAKTLISSSPANRLSATIRTFKLVSEFNILVLGAAVPVLLVIPGFLDEILATLAIVVLGSIAVVLRKSFIRNRKNILEKLTAAEAAGKISKRLLDEAVKNLNAITISR